MAVQTVPRGRRAEHRTGHHDSARFGRPRRRTSRIADIVLTLGALLGVVTASWLGYAHLTGATVVVLETGSMAPTMPQSTAAVAVPVPAAELRVGDVVTVRRDDASPWVTHRVVAVAPVEGNDERRSLTLQGDANTTPDLFPYEVDGALRTMYSVPNGAPVTRVLEASAFRAGMLVVVAGMLVWAFWPTTSHRSQEPTRRRGKWQPVAGRHRADG